MMRLTVLDPEEVEAIHQASLRVLAETGIQLTHSKGRELLTGRGAVVKDERVFLPPELVESEMAFCPHQVHIRGRQGETKSLGDGNLHWHNLGGAREVYDHRTGKRHPAKLQDVRNSARLLDALEGATSITPFFTPQDVPGHLMSLTMYRHSIPHTTKPLQGPGVQNGKEVELIVRMAEVIGPPSEVLSLAVSPVSPLIFTDDAVEAILAIAEAGVPFGPLPCPTAGTTAPLTIAGAIVQQNAEVLASIVLAQLVKPGLPIIYCGRLAMMEPRTGISVWGGVELGMASAGTVQVAHRYHLPVNVYGLSTNAHTLDIQSGFERSLNSIIPALAGADELSGIGEMEAGIMGSYAQMVCDNEIVASIQRIQRGFTSDEQALAVEVIASTISSNSNFLTQKHTTLNLRAGEMLLTTLADRRSWETWDREGRDGMAERAQAEAERLLEDHQVPPLDKNQEQELDSILTEANRVLTE